MCGCQPPPLPRKVTSMHNTCLLPSFLTLQRGSNCYLQGTRLCSGGKTFFTNACAPCAAAVYLTCMRNWILFLIAAGLGAGPLCHLGIPWDAAKAAATAALPLAIYVFGVKHKTICSGRSKMEIYFFFQLYLFP